MRLGQFWEQFNTKPDWLYQFTNLTSANVEIKNNRLNIEKPTALGNAYNCSVYVLPVSGFQKLDNGFGNNRFTNPCYKKISVSVDYETEHPGKSAVIFPFSYREMSASIAIIARETNFSQTTINNRYVSLGTRSIVYSNQTGDQATNTITASAGVFGEQLNVSQSQGGQVFNKGKLTLSCEFTGLRSNGYVNDWLWRFTWNDVNEIYQYNANAAKLIGWGDACNFDIVLEARFFSNNFTEVWPSKSIWFDNLKVEHIP